MSFGPLLTDESVPMGSVDRHDPSHPVYAPKSVTGVSLCQACRVARVCRLGLSRETLGTDGVVISEVSCPRDQEGGPEVAHGGWTAGILDELVGHALLAREEFAVTGTLTVKFVRPVPVEWPLIGKTWITGRERRKVFVSASLELADSGAIVATADAIMVKRPVEHFALHQQWLQSQTAGAVIEP